MPLQEIEQLLEQLITQQAEKVAKCGNSILPHLTDDDLLQPNDFPELENHPFFRYEEGVLAGLQTARMAFLALKEDLYTPDSKNGLIH